MDLSKHELAKQSLAAGATLSRERLGLVVLLYAVNLVMALILAFPFYFAFVEHVGETGFGPEMIQSFDLMLWREVLDGIGETMKVVGFQLLWVLPVYMLWKTAAYMGVIYALHQGAIWPFWRGVGYYTAKGFLLALIFLPIKAIVAGIAILLGVALGSIWTGEVGAFWSFGVVMPILVVSALAVTDLFQRYARIAVVVRHDSVTNALYSGIRWPIRYGAASYVYLAWFAVMLLILVATQTLNALVHVGMQAIVVGFLLQQVSLFTRAIATVGWIGSEVSLFERTHLSELPLIADAVTVEMPAWPPQGDSNPPSIGTEPPEGPALA